MPAFTNIKDSPALRGEDAIVTISAAQAAQYMRSINLGQRAVVTSSGYQGYVSQVDVYGVSFKVKPQYPSSYFSSTINASGGGILLAGEVVTLF